MAVTYRETSDQVSGRRTVADTSAISADLLQSAERHLDDCHLCPHHCGTERSAAAGFCRVGRTSYIASEMLHMGEESLLRPAHAIFLSGCTARCTFCTAAKFAFVPTYGVAVSPRQLAERIVLRQGQGARSICFIGGDPVPHIPFILATIAALGTRKTVPVVINSNFYLSDEALDLLEPAIDIYLPDLKFGPHGEEPNGGVSSRGEHAGEVHSRGEHNCGEAIGGMPEYWPVVTTAIDRLHRRGEQVIVRHLLMPGHFECCTAPVLKWLSKRAGIQVSLLTQYIAPAHVRGELAASLLSDDVLRAQAMAADLGLILVD
jgi:putative pyruvate formate lyase activating enzyme